MLGKFVKKTIAIIFGTRPEAIKLAPVVLALKKDKRFRCRVCVTAQHRHMLDQVLDIFGIVPDVDLNLMKKNQTLAGFTARAITAVDGYLADEKPDLVMVQGDTTTVFAASLAAFYHHIPVAHVEAGLRTGNLQSPWPEELNRVLTTRMAALHFAPTASNRKNLIKEDIPSKNIVVTGNTVIDALFLALAKVSKNPPHIPGLPQALQPTAHASRFTSHSSRLTPPTPLVLITGHRRENFGGGFENICRAIALLARQFPKTHFVYPVHLNPRVREPVMRILSPGAPGAMLPNVHLIEPLDYLSFVALMNRATLILTDSGGVQEEAPSLGKPVIVMRDTTERPEAVKAGTVKVVGADTRNIVRAAAALLTRPALYKKMSTAYNPYGDGHATERIVSACRAFLTPL
jgi:UDP-N-acetylglucosamine 2-epimerase (non-hydrolysing)